VGQAHPEKIPRFLTFPKPNIRAMVRPGFPAGTRWFADLGELALRCTRPYKRAHK
jgi:hypothetical protein